MAPKGRGRKKAEVVEVKLEVQDAVQEEETKAKKGGKAVKAPTKMKNNIEMNGSAELQEKAETNEEKLETESGSDVNANDQITSKHPQKAVKKVVKVETNEDEAKEEDSEIEVKSKDLPAKRGRKAPVVKNGIDSIKVENEANEEQIETESGSDVITNEKVASKRQKTVKAEVKEESSKAEAKPEDLPAKRGRKAAVAKNGVDSTKDEDVAKIDKETKEPPKSRRRGKVEAESSDLEKEQIMPEQKETKAKTTRKAKAQSEEPVEKEAPSKESSDIDEEPTKPETKAETTRKAKVQPKEKPVEKEAGRKRKNVVEDTVTETAKKVKEENPSKTDKKIRELRVALKRSKGLDELAREQMEAKAAEETKTKNMKGPAKGKGKRAAASDAEKSQPVKKTKENTSKSKSGANKEKDKTPDLTSLDFDNSSKTADGKPWNLKIATWNVNGIRAWLQKDGLSYLHHEKPDIMCIQETKCSDDKLPPEVNVEGYHCHWLAGDKDGYSGVGLLSKEKPISVQYGINMEKHDTEGRVITAEYDGFYLVTTYIPNAGRGLKRLEYRQEWDKDFRTYLKKLDEKKPVVLCGDLNVAHEEIDIANPKSNKKNAGFTQEEREGFSTLLSEGFVDTFRQLYPDQKGAYTFWTYMMNARAKNVGWRLDYFVISKRFVDHLCDSVIRKDVYGSDHCPLTLFLHV